MDTKAMVDVDQAAPSSEPLAFDRGLQFAYLWHEERQLQQDHLQQLKQLQILLSNLKKNIVRESTSLIEYI